jgi:hypothetical protein
VTWTGKGRAKKNIWWRFLSLPFTTSQYFGLSATSRQRTFQTVREMDTLIGILKLFNFPAMTSILLRCIFFTILTSNKVWQSQCRLLIMSIHANFIRLSNCMFLDVIKCAPYVPVPKRFGPVSNRIFLLMAFNSISINQSILV